MTGSHIRRLLAGLGVFLLAVYAGAVGITGSAGLSVTPAIAKPVAKCREIGPAVQMTLKFGALFERVSRGGCQFPTRKRDNLFSPVVTNFALFGMAQCRSLVVG